LDTETQIQYDNYFTLFRTDGWKQFIEDMQELYDTYSIEDIKDELQLSRVQGERHILNQILKFEWAIQNSYDFFINEESLDD
jgi:hypothetical protein